MMAAEAAEWLFNSTLTQVANSCLQKIDIPFRRWRHWNRKGEGGGKGCIGAANFSSFRKDGWVFENLWKRLQRRRCNNIVRFRPHHWFLKSFKIGGRKSIDFRFDFFLFRKIRIYDTKDFSLPRDSNLYLDDALSIIYYKLLTIFFVLHLHFYKKQCFLCVHFL